MLVVVFVVIVVFVVLQQACGFEYTSKLQRMFQDMSLSKDLNDRFRQHISASGDPLDCEFQYRTSNVNVNVE